MLLLNRQRKSHRSPKTQDFAKHQTQSQIAMDTNTAPAQAFERHYESVVAHKASFSGHAFNIPKYTSFNPMTPVDFASLSALESTSSEGLSWNPDDSNYFAHGASRTQDMKVAPLSPLANPEDSNYFGHGASHTHDMQGAPLSPLATPSVMRDGIPPWMISMPANKQGNVPYTREGWRPCSSPEGCNTLALRTLRKLHVATEECLSSSEDDAFQSSGGQQPRQARPMDAILSQLEQASFETASILECSCCMKVQLQTLVASILEKLVEWCGAIVRAMPTGDEAGGGRPEREQVSRQPITIGNHQLLDDTLEMRVVTQVVMDKLSRVEGLVEELASRFEESNVGRTGTGNTSAKFSVREAGLLDIIRDRLVDCLRGQIATVRGSLIQLQRCSSAI